MAKKTKVKATKKTQTKQKQKQKQHQKQTVIVNVNTKKSTRSTSRPSKSASQPLITTLPIQYTPYTMYDLSNTRQQDADARYIIQPRIPNAIPNLDIKIPSVNNTIADPITTTIPITAGVEGSGAGTEKEKEKIDEQFELETQYAQTMLEPSQDNILKEINKKRAQPFTSPKKNNDDNMKKDVSTDRYYTCPICMPRAVIKNTPSSISTHEKSIKHRNALVRPDIAGRHIKPAPKKEERKSESESSKSIRSPAFKPPPPPSSPEGARFIGETVIIKRTKKKAVQNEL